MKNVVIKLLKGDRVTIYISVKKIPEILFSIQHKLRIKSALYNCTVVSYNKGMDFTNARSTGSVIIQDNRDQIQLVENGPAN